MNGGSPAGDPRRGLPSVEALLAADEVRSWIEAWGRTMVLRAIRETLATTRGEVAEGGGAPDAAELLARVHRELRSDRPSLRRVVNATGVILHTNLGRAPLAGAAAREAAVIAGGYSNLEYDLDLGARGDRYGRCAGLLADLTGSESSLVVNNNAAAVSLVINTLARGRDVIVSRGELVEIGGGFRIPDVIGRSGAFLCAVGTTNRTRLEDFRKAITPSAGLLLKVHPSNYRVEGFTESPALADLVALGRSTSLPVMHDLGAGLLLENLVPELPEPSIRDSVAAGVDLVTWSGDKLLGGPQAGIVHGRSVLVNRLRANPLARAFRVDKVTLSALEATLRLYRSPEKAIRAIPVLRMLSEPLASVERRARVAFEELEARAQRKVSVSAMRSVLGGGSAPGFGLESAGWMIAGAAVESESWLRHQDPPVIGRIEAGTLMLDFRTVLEGEEQHVCRAVAALAANATESA